MDGCWSSSASLSCVSIFSLDKDELRARYEARGDEQDFVAAKAMYEQELAGSDGNARLHLDYGYLLECHARNELRRAAAEYERAIALSPSDAKGHYQWISARAGLQEPEIAVVAYERLLADQPGDLQAHRLLVAAYLAAHAYAKARSVIEDGLALFPDDPVLIDGRGRVRAGLGDIEGALADWRRALELDPENLSPVYSRAFLLEREDRIREAMEAWRSIIEWSTVRGAMLDTEWPQRELERLRHKAAGKTALT